MGNLVRGDRQNKYSAASAGRKTTKREKLSCRLQIYRGNSLPEGETIAIVTIIELEFIGIIIIIISTTRTIIITITTSSCCNISGKLSRYQLLLVLDAIE